MTYVLIFLVGVFVGALAMSLIISAYDIKQGDQ